MAPEPGAAGDPEPGPKSLTVAWLLALALGLFGAHHLYLGRIVAGAFYAALTVTGLATAPWGIGFVFGALVILLVLIDLVRLPGLVRRANGGL